MFAPTCFGPPGPFSGSLCRALLKLQFSGRLSIGSLKMVQMDRNV